VAGAAFAPPLPMHRRARRPNGCPRVVGVCSFFPRVPFRTRL